MRPRRRPITGKVTFIRDLGGTIETFLDVAGTEVVAVSTPRERPFVTVGQDVGIVIDPETRGGAVGMRREPPKTALDYAPLAFPAGMLILFFVVPFATMIAVSFFRRDPAGFYSPDFVFDNYARFLSFFFGGVLSFSLMLAIGSPWSA